MQQGEWTALGERLADAAQKIEKAGADFLLICTNTMHKVAQTITDAVDIPLLHIADATGEKVKTKEIHTVGLLGTIQQSPSSTQLRCMSSWLSDEPYRTKPGVAET